MTTPAAVTTLLDIIRAVVTRPNRGGDCYIFGQHTHASAPEYGTFICSRRCFKMLEVLYKLESNK